MIRTKSVALLALSLLLPLLFVSTKPTTLELNDLGHVSLLVSESGLNFAKNLLIEKAISTVIPLQLPDIEKKVKIPLVGKVRMGLSDIQISAVDVVDSWIKTLENGGIVLGITGATAELSMNWSYTYTALFIEISDRGDASVKVEGMDIRVAVSLIEHEGSLRMDSVASYCKVKSIDINIDGGASWLYQGVIDAFQKRIISAVKEAVSKKIEENMEKLDSLLQSIPKQKLIDDSASVNLTFTGNPVFGDSSVQVRIDGLFVPNNHVKVLEHGLKGSRSPFFFDRLNRMVKISIEEEVFDSATRVYFNAERMHLVIEETKNLSVLDTADWKLILPEMYNLYPNDKMKLEISVTSPPSVKITEKGIDAAINLDTTVDVLDAGEVIPVACFSTVLNVSCSAEVSKNDLAGSLRLVDFNSSVKWSKVGELHANSAREAMAAVLEAAFFPYVNERLGRGFPLPIPRGFDIRGTEIVYADSRVMVCSDISYT